MTWADGAPFLRLRGSGPRLLLNDRRNRDDGAETNARGAVCRLRGRLSWGAADRDVRKGKRHRAPTSELSCVEVVSSH